MSFHICAVLDKTELKEQNLFLPGDPQMRSCDSILQFEVLHKYAYSFTCCFRKECAVYKCCVCYTTEHA